MVPMIRLVQLRRGGERRVALVDEPRLRLLANVETLYELAGAALARSRPLMALVEDSVSPLKPLSDDALDYDAVYAGKSAWRSEEHTSELQSRRDIVCRLLLEKKKI